MQDIVLSLVAISGEQDLEIKMLLDNDKNDYPEYKNLRKVLSNRNYVVNNLLDTANKLGLFEEGEISE